MNREAQPFTVGTSQGPIRADDRQLFRNGRLGDPLLQVLLELTIITVAPLAPSRHH
jgi:hypothetical protein